MTDRPPLDAEFYKAHGLGNDYLVFREGADWLCTPDAVASVCDRCTGVGSDGIVVLLGNAGTPSAPFALRMFNPDGSEFERSGNGLRVFGAFVFSRGWVGHAPFDVDVGGDRVRLEVGRVEDASYDISVEMGRTEHGPDAVRLDPAALDPAGRMDLGALGRVEVRPVSVGNPHAVVFGEGVGEARLAELGPRLALHEAFRNGTNVQLAQVVDAGTVEARIWERGVGPTASSGTSACAVAAAAVESGRVEPGEIEVVMPGGRMWVSVGQDRSVSLRGPVAAVYEGRLDPDMLKRLGSTTS